MRVKFHFSAFFCFVFSLFIASGVGQSEKIGQDLSFEDLELAISNLKNKPADQLRYISIFIIKAKDEKNEKQLWRGYVLAASSNTGKDQTRFADSALITAKKINDVNLIGDTYLLKGMCFLNEENYPLALDSYLEGFSFIAKKGDPYLLHNTQYQIAQTKSYLGQHKEANNLFRSCTEFFRKNKKQIGSTDYRYYYIYSLIALIDTNSKLGNHEENVGLIEEGKNFIKTQSKFQDLFPYVLSSEAMNSYFGGNYETAISQFHHTLQIYNDQWKHLTDKYYLGMSYWQINKKEEAVPYFLLLNKEYDDTGKIDPQFRPAFEKLIEYSHAKSDINKELEYINKLIALDKQYEKDYKYLYAELHTRYDGRLLREEKNRLEKKLSNRTGTAFVAAAVSLILSIMLFIVYRKYKKRDAFYKKLLSEVSGKETVSVEMTNGDEVVNLPYENNLGINPLVVEQVMAQLHEFEKKKLYLKKGITLSSLAKSCSTNTAYLSKIINHYKNAGFAEYLNSLRLEYTVQQWKLSPKTRYQSMQEIAEKAGYNSTQAFAKNFQEKYQIPPSYFLNRLNKEKIAV